MVFRIVMAAMAALIAGLAISSAIMLVVVGGDKPLHHTYACDFSRDYRQEVHLPPAACNTP
jgi:hypothetical protein